MVAAKRNHMPNPDTQAQEVHLHMLKRSEKTEEGATLGHSYIERLDTCKVRVVGILT